MHTARGLRSAFFGGASAIAVVMAVGCSSGSDTPQTVCPLTTCGTSCVDTANDPKNCGACGKACGTNEYCASGTCKATTTTAPGCPSGELSCSGSCVDPKTDRAHCGASGDCTGANAGTACADGEVCDGSGKCAVSCQSGLIACGGTCVDPNVSDAFCGATGDCTGANAGTACPAGERCNGKGVCALTCETGYSVCGGHCVADALGMIDCGGTCIDPKTSAAFCGASADCTGGNAGVACTNTQLCLASTCVTAQTTFAFTGATTTYTVPAGVSMIRIEADGAQGGGNNGGLGATIVGTFDVTPGEVLNVLVGGRGDKTQGAAGGGGGGGSFVTTANNLPLVIAGGGGGVNNQESVAGGAGQAGPAGGAAGDGTAGGANGAGGAFGAANTCGCGGPGSGGGGFFGNGVNSGDGGGNSFVNGAAGGTDWSGNCIMANAGGFGGGGSSGNAGGGGGGYSGGAGGSNTCTQSDRAGGGGGSFNTGSNQTNTAGARAGDGQVIITIVD